MSSHLALPCCQHLQQLFHMFAYLKKHHNSELVFDPSNPIKNEGEFKLHDWTSREFGHIQGMEKLLLNMLQLRGMGFVMHAKVMPPTLSPVNPIPKKCYEDIQWMWIWRVERCPVQSCQNTPYPRLHHLDCTAGHRCEQVM